MTITFIGGGNMATALIGGLIKHGFPTNHFSVIDNTAEARAKLKEKFGVATFSDIETEVVNSQIIVLAVKPQQLQAVASQMNGMLKDQVILSIAAGINTATISKWLNGYSRIVRAMPNTPAMVSMGVSALFAMPEVTSQQKTDTEAVLKAVGATLWVGTESELNAITAVSGSGPGYVFYFMEALETAAVELGCPPDEARFLAIQTFLGAAQLIAQTGEAPSVLRARVTSKGGTTEKALEIMEQAGLKAHFVAAVRAAALRSEELEQQFSSS